MRASSAACRRSLKKEPLTICKTRSLVPHFSASLRNYRVVAHFRSAVSFRGSTDKLKARVAAGFLSLVCPSQLLAGILDVRLCFVAARRRAPMPSLRCRHTASSSAPPLRLSKMQDTPPAPRFYALLRNYRSVAHFRSAVSFRGSTDKLKARVAAGFFFFSVILHNYLRGFLMFACAAARRAIGTRKGEQDT